MPETQTPLVAQLEAEVARLTAQNREQAGKLAAVAIVVHDIYCNHIDILPYRVGQKLDELSRILNA